MKLDGVIISLAGAAFRQLPRQRVGADCRIRQTVEGCHHVVGRHRLAVMELDVLAQLEGPDCAIRIWRPAFGRKQSRRQIRPRKDTRLAELRQHGHTASVGDGHRIDRPRRDDQSKADGPARRAGPRRGRRQAIACSPSDAAQNRRRKSQHRAKAREVAAADRAAHQTVDQVVFMLGTAVAETVEQLVIDRYVIPSCGSAMCHLA